MICDQKAIGRYTCDIDVKGLGFCKKHKSKVNGLAMWLVIVPELFEKMLKDERKIFKRTDKKDKLNETNKQFRVI